MNDQEQSQNQALAKARIDGMEWMKDYVVSRLKGKICFDHVETGNCKHQLCFGVVDFIDELEGKK
jgi:hypothetical protein